MNSRRAKIPLRVRLPWSPFAHSWGLAFALAFVVGMGIRLWALPLWGTFDNEVQKAWSSRAATAGVADIYGPPDRELIAQARARGGSLLVQLATQPVPMTRFQWGSATYFVDYPPGSVLELWAAGKLYSWYAPALPNRPAFNAAINLIPLLASLVIAGLLYRTAPGRTGTIRALAFWLNPAVILAAPVLGYQDTIFGAFALAAVLQMMAGRLATATALVVVAGLVKPQGALLLPTLAVVLVREAHGSTRVRAVLAGAGAAAVVLAPWWASGYLLSALDGCRRPLGQGTLAPLGLNVWWIAGYVMRWQERGPWPLADIVSIDAFRAWAGWDPRWVSRMLLGATTLASMTLLAKSAPGQPREARAGMDRRMIPLSVILQVHAYALLGTSVHENHTFLAVVLAPLLLGARPRAAALLAGTSAFLFANLFLAAGFGRRLTSLRSLEDLRAATGLDLSVIVAAAHVGLVALIAAWTARTAPRPGPEGATRDARIRAEE